MNKKKRARKLVLTCGILGLMMFTGVPTSHSNPLQPMTTYAAEQNLPYSHRWETQADGNWKYKMDDGSYAVNKWIQDEVDKNWYLLDGSGIMRSGIYKSYGKYYLLSEIHDGHFGHLVKNGEVYNGVAIKASTNADDEGALSSETINALKSLGYNIDTVQDVSGTSHVTDGKVSVQTDTTTEKKVEVTQTETNTAVYSSLQEEIEAKNRAEADELWEKYKDQITGSGSDTSDILINGKPIH